MQTGRTPPYLTHNRILTWEVAEARDSPDPVVVPFPAPPLFLSSPRGPWSPFLFRRRRWDRDRDRDFDQVYETCLRHRSGLQLIAAAVGKERLFRSIPKIDLFFRSCRSRRLIDRGRNGWIVSALDRLRSPRYIQASDLRPTMMRPMTNGFSECCGRTRR